jgi:hypothetical protein
LRGPFAGHLAGGDVEPVPGVDRGDVSDQGGQRWLTECVAASSRAIGLWTPARSARLTRITAIVMIRASSETIADTSNPREHPTDSA